MRRCGEQAKGTGALRLGMVLALTAMTTACVVRDDGGSDGGRGSGGYGSGGGLLNGGLFGNSGGGSGNGGYGNGGYGSGGGYGSSGYNSGRGYGDSRDQRVRDAVELCRKQAAQIVQKAGGKGVEVESVRDANFNNGRVYITANMRGRYDGDDKEGRVRCAVDFRGGDRVVDFSQNGLKR